MVISLIHILLATHIQTNADLEKQRKHVGQCHCMSLVMCFGESRHFLPDFHQPIWNFTRPHSPAITSYFSNTCVKFHPGNPNYNGCTNRLLLFLFDFSLGKATISKTSPLNRHESRGTKNGTARGSERLSGLGCAELLRFGAPGWVTEEQIGTDDTNRTWGCSWDVFFRGFQLTPHWWLVGL